MMPHLFSVHVVHLLEEIPLILASAEAFDDELVYQILMELCWGDGKGGYIIFTGDFLLMQTSR